MKKIKIGIPRSLYYYYYGDLLKNFFENLNCEELCAIDGGNKAQDVGYQVGKYIGITATFILKLMGY